MINLQESYTRTQESILRTAKRDEWYEVTEDEGAAIGQLVSEGLITQREDKYRLTTRGLEVKETLDALHEEVNR